MTSLVAIVDAPDLGGGPAALLPSEFEEGYAEQGPPTVLRKLLELAKSLGVGTVAVVARAAWAESVAARCEDGVEVLSYAEPGGALAAVAALLEGVKGPVVLLHGETVLHGGALADVVSDPRLGTAVLTAPQPGGTLLVREGRAVAAGSGAHRLDGGTHACLGVLQVADADRATLAAAARELAVHAADSGWDADPLDLLALGAVRRGLVVAAVPIATYIWARPRSVADAHRVTQRIAASDERRLRLDAVARPDDGFYSTFVVRKISRRVTEFAVGKSWTPNQITIASLGIGLLAAVCFAVGNRVGLIAGALLLQVSLVVDCVDGEVARFTRRFTALGAWLDATSDRVKEYGVYAGLAVGATRAGESAWTLAAATLALQVFRNFVDFGFVARLAERKAAVRGERAPLDRTDAGPAPVGRPASAAAPAAASLGRGAVSLSERTSKLPALKWAKRMVFLPIGERWLIISVGAAISGPRLVFGILLGLGVLSAVYATAGRVLRSVASSDEGGGTAPPAGTAPAQARTTGVLPRGELVDLVDLGVGARLLGRAAARSKIPQLGAVALACGLAVLVGLVTASNRAGEVLAAVGVVAVVAAASPAWGRPLDGRFGWLLPGLVRGIEYGLVVRLVAVVDPGAMPAAFAYLCAVTYHHYDTVYRWRHTRRGPELWIFGAGLGHDGRLLLLAVLLASGVALGPALTVLAAGLGALYVAESAGAWRAWLASRPAVS